MNNGPVSNKTAVDNSYDWLGRIISFYAAHDASYKCLIKLIDSCLFSLLRGFYKTDAKSWLQPVYRRVKSPRFRSL